MKPITQVDQDDIISLIDDLVRRNQRIENTWKNAHGWAPPQAARLLQEARLDRQVALTRCLKIWCAQSPPTEVEGRLILAWVNLRSLVEGSFKFFLSIYADDYSASHQQLKQTKNHGGPDGLMLNSLIEFFEKIVWLDDQSEKLQPFVRLAQERGNAIHAYRHREMGTFKEFFEGIRRYSELLSMIEAQLPPEPEYEAWR